MSKGVHNIAFSVTPDGTFLETLGGDVGPSRYGLRLVLWRITPTTRRILLTTYSNIVTVVS
jgi:hypothetical protein